MKYTLIVTCRSLYTLLRFIFWYTLGAALLLYLLPQAALFLQQEYDSLAFAVRISLLFTASLLIAVGLFKAFQLRKLSSTL